MLWNNGKIDRSFVEYHFYPFIHWEVKIKFWKKWNLKWWLWKRWQICLFSLWQIECWNKVGRSKKWEHISIKCLLILLSRADFVKNESIYVWVLVVSRKKSAECVLFWWIFTFILMGIINVMSQGYQLICVETKCNIEKLNCHINFHQICRIYFVFLL